MSFDPKTLPPTVYQSYKENKAISWMVTVQFAISHKLFDLNDLTNIAFYLHHPELDGRSIELYEVDLIAQWKSFRTLIKPLLSNSGKTKSNDRWTDLINSSGGWTSSNSNRDSEYNKWIDISRF